MKNPEMIPIDKLKAFENHPYRVEENEEKKTEYYHRLL